jgi:hypothetical protein
MLKQKTALEVKNGERTYTLDCAADSPLGELYDALCQMQSYVIGRIVESQKPKESQSEVVEPAEILKD